MAENSVNGVIRRLRRVALRRDLADLTDGELLEQYLAGREEAAFELLLRRHGAMVLGVCRRVLRNEADAEDAFQATFLVFVRKAASIRSRAAVGNWLYGVAHNTALKAKAMNHHRRAKEREAGSVPKDETPSDARQEMVALLDGELSSLPDKYRIPIVLCDLEGRTITDAARHLGWPQGTLATRLSRGRARLAQTMTKKGLTFAGGLIPAAVSQAASSVLVPPSLVASTVHAAPAVAAGQATAACAIPAAVATLADMVVKTMLTRRLRALAIVLLATAVLAGGSILLNHRIQAAKHHAVNQIVSPSPPFPEGQSARHGKDKTSRQELKEAKGDDAEAEEARAGEARRMEAQLREAQAREAKAKKDAEREVEPAVPPDLKFEPEKPLAIYWTGWTRILVWP
jgi:RNA polymerase sigma-70 factor (ECF subfamily)